MFKPKNEEWSVEGDYYLVKTFKDLLEDKGWFYVDGNFDVSWAAYGKILKIFNNTKRFMLAEERSREHFYLPDDWSKAVEYAAIKKETHEKETYQEEDWVWSVSGALVVYTEKNDYTYGFGSLGFWANHFDIKRAIEMNRIERKATNEEIENALWNEWKGRCEDAGVEDYENAKLKEHIGEGDPETLNSNQFISMVGADGDGYEVWNKNGLVFNKGRWATPIKEKQLTFGGEPVTLESKSVIPVSESEIAVECQGVKGSLRQVLNILRINENMGVWFAGTRVTHIDEKEIPFKRSRLSTVTIGCLTGTFEELREIYKEGQKLLNQ